MKKQYAIVAILLMLFTWGEVKALKIGDCEVLVSFKVQSSLDDDTFICKGKVFGDISDTIYYDGKDKIILDDFNTYYFSYLDHSINLSIEGINNISLLNLNEEMTINGQGSLRFREASYVMKVKNGEQVYNYLYKNKYVLDNDNLYEGTLTEFKEAYDNIKTNNKLPKEFSYEDYSLEQVIDYEQMSSQVVSEAWLEKNIITNLDKSIVDGYGILEYVEHKEESKLEDDNVTLISNKKMNKKYKLSVNDLSSDDSAKKINDEINDNLVGYYDINVKNGKKEVPIKDGSYVIKIKVDYDTDLYSDYRIIYVDDNGSIKEYIDATIEDDYIVFKTSHLSHYGIVATDKKIKETIIPVNYQFNYSLLIGLIVLFTTLVFSCKLYIYTLKNSKKSYKKRRTN